MGKSGDLPYDEHETDQDAGFSAWLKARGAGSAELEDRADEETDRPLAGPESSDDRSDT